MSPIDPAALPLPEGVGETVRTAFARRGVVRTYPARAMLWHAGATPRGLHLVLDGEVRIVRSTGGRSHVIHAGRRGALLGQVPLFAGGGYPATAVAAPSSSCLVVGRPTVVEALARDPAFANHLVTGMAERIRFLVDRLDSRSARTVSRRIMEHLWDRADVRGGTWTRLGVTQAELAQEVGTVREVVVRAMADLRAAGLLESDGRGRYRVPDPGAWAERLDDGREDP